MNIGYGKPLAEVVENIELTEGLHFLLARNGRGKTTLLKTISGLLRAVSGDFTLEGRSKFIADDLAFDSELPARMIFQAFVAKERLGDASQLAERIELDIRKPFGKLSFGNRKKVGLLVAECGLEKGDVILYDEPFTGLDTPARETLLELWSETEGEALRLVSCHPDLDEMSMPSAMLISNARIEMASQRDKTWAELKKTLN
jgi:ABC-type multidrug transport system ATPase subunit